MSKEKSTEVTTFTGKTNLAARSENVGRGSENVSAADLAIPRLKLLQLISDEVKPGHAKQVDGAQAGMILNSVTNELFSSLFVINLHFAKKTVVWRKRKAGGGIVGTFDDEAQALASLNEMGLKAEDLDISENPTHLVLILSDEGEPKSVALLDMPGTKVKKSKIWNTNIQEQEKEGNPRFGCVWQLGVVNETSAQGDYFNYDIDLVAHAPDELYAKAEAAYKSFFSAPEEQEEAA